MMSDDPFAELFGGTPANATQTNAHKTAPKDLMTKPEVKRSEPQDDHQSDGFGDFNAAAKEDSKGSESDGFGSFDQQFD
jgi:hypothetical protein